MRRTWLTALAAQFAIVLVLLSLLSTPVKTCGQFFSLLPYVAKDFWLPFSLGAGELLPRGPRQANLPFAGYRTDPARPEIVDLSELYQEFAFPQGTDEFSGFAAPDAKAFVPLNAAVKSALDAKLSAEEREEALLLDAKIAMRMGECSIPGQLEVARAKFEAFLRKAKDAAYLSEARGWLARVHYLLGDYPQAVKIYIDELYQPESNIPRQTIVDSIRIVFGRDRVHVETRLNEYFDSPRHALFVVNYLTDAESNARDLRRATRTGRLLVEALSRRESLFGKDQESEALALALMRCAAFSGDPAAVLRFAARVQGKPSARPGDYYWMVASANFLLRRYPESEAALWTLYRLPRNGDRERASAAAALAGVYEQLKNRVEQLHALFLYESLWEDGSDPYSSQVFFWPTFGQSLDLAYLLDIGLSEEQLREFLTRYPRPVGKPLTTRWSGTVPRTRSSVEAVRYSLAVRYARRGDFEAAAREYQAISAFPRARRMREIARLHSAWASATDGRQKLEAKYRYASYLTDHSTQILFNDLFWRGYQREALVTRGYDYSPIPQLSGGQYRTRQADERRLLDEQEERWQAFLLLDQIVSEAGRSPLGVKAAQKAVDCLSGINEERFGRQDDIAAAQKRLLALLRNR